MPTVSLSRRTVNVSACPGARRSERPSSRAKPSGSAIAPKVNNCSPSFRTVKILEGPSKWWATLPKSMGETWPLSISFPFARTVTSGGKAVTSPVTVKPNGFSSLSFVAKLI